MNQHLRVLVVEDDPNDVELTLRELRRGGYDVTHERVEDREGMRAALKREMWDLVIADYSLPRFSAPEALRLLKESGIDLPFVRTFEELLRCGGLYSRLYELQFAREDPAV